MSVVPMLIGPALGHYSRLLPIFCNLNYQFYKLIFLLQSKTKDCSPSYYYWIKPSFVDLAIRTLTNFIIPHLPALISYYYSSTRTVHSGHTPLRGMLKHRLLSPFPRDFDLAGLGWDLRIYTSKAFPVVLMLLVQIPHFENIDLQQDDPLLYRFPK